MHQRIDWQEAWLIQGVVVVGQYTVYWTPVCEGVWGWAPGSKFRRPPRASVAAQPAPPPSPRAPRLPPPALLGVRRPRGAPRNPAGLRGRRPSAPHEQESGQQAPTWQPRDPPPARPRA